MALTLVDDRPRLRLVPDTTTAECSHCGTEPTPSNEVFRMSDTDPVEFACLQCLSTTPGRGIS